MSCVAGVRGRELQPPFEPARPDWKGVAGVTGLIENPYELRERWKPPLSEVVGVG